MIGGSLADDAAQQVHLQSKDGICFVIDRVLHDRRRQPVGSRQEVADVDIYIRACRLRDRRPTGSRSQSDWANHIVAIDGTSVQVDNHPIIDDKAKPKKSAGA